MCVKVGMRRVTRLDTIKKEYIRGSLEVTNIAGEIKENIFEIA